ncbi:V [Bat mastadenovirus WIV12]|uniref:V n=1 Tax=Bat mastadenovirus WIV12 TaxID=1788434 RepID=A0A1B0UI09_9ADEN|nr:V [Bat mastadenovirus WIV12] [Bat mastadenovirus WIV12]AMB43154.1 V [Bat mastadenovirus WIV12] [Bat mastadenovirus WIV12]
MASRPIKEEMSQVLLSDEVEFPQPKKNKRKRSYKDDLEPEYKDIKRDIKPIIKEIEKAIIAPPRRKYRWRGRKVQKILRPGSAIMLSSVPKTRQKRTAEEMHTDIDILDQASKKEGEFAYGKMPHLEIQTNKRKRERDISPHDDFITTELKKQKIALEMPVLKRKRPSSEIESFSKKRKSDDSFVALDNYNPTPNMQPITEQQVLPINRKRGGTCLQPTCQLLASKKRKIAQRADRSEANMEVEMPVSTENGSEMVRADVKVRPIKKVAPGIGIRTVDVDIPLQNSVQNIISSTVSTSESLPSTFVAPFQETKSKKMIPDVKYHPSISTSKIPRRKKYPSANSIIPEAVYHPSIDHPRAKKKIIPEVRYHPSIAKARRYTV